MLGWASDAVILCTTVLVRATVYLRIKALALQAFTNPSGDTVCRSRKFLNRPS